MTLTALITGGTSGIGLSLSRILVDQGWKVTCLGRRSMTGSEGTVFASADFAELATIRGFVASNSDQWDLLVMNAGIGTCRPGHGARSVSHDGYELRFQVNYLAHYFLLIGLIEEGRLTTDFRCTAIITERIAVPDFKEIHMGGSYDAHAAYSRSKGALAMLCLDVCEGIYGFGRGRAITCDPGSYIPTGMDRPGRPRLTPLSLAVERVEAAMAKTAAGRCGPADFAHLPAAIRSKQERERLREVSNVLVRNAVDGDMPAR